MHILQICIEEAISNHWIVSSGTKLFMPLKTLKMNSSSENDEFGLCTR